LSEATIEVCTTEGVVTVWTPGGIIFTVRKGIGPHTTKIR
jgi:hypothetical protein